MTKKKLHRVKTTNLIGEEVFEDDRFLNQDNPWEIWHDMPHYEPEDPIQAFLELEIEFENQEAIDNLSKQIGQDITDRTKSIWFPKLDITRYKSVKYVSDYDESNYPKYPIYIVSKGRWKIRLTSDSLVEMKIKHYMIVEESQLAEYQTHTDPNFVELLVLPQKYLDEYDTCDDLGFTKSKGPGAARNFAWEHAKEAGHKRHWVMDDNLRGFYRHDSFNRTPATTGAIFRAMEDHTDRYQNCPISGMNYRFIAVPDRNRPPLTTNTRIYSCLLIDCSLDLRWRGRYNEDTDLSLRVLKMGLCTIQYNAFTNDKVVTQGMKGGNTDEFYSKEGTKPKSEMLERLHPDVASTKWINNRWHHYVDYSPFKSNRLIAVIDPYINPDPEYKMQLKYEYNEGE